MSQLGHQILMLTGELNVDERAATIAAFKRAERRLLISTNVSARGKFDRVRIRLQ